MTEQSQSFLPTKEMATLESAGLGHPKVRAQGVRSAHSSTMTG